MTTAWMPRRLFSFFLCFTSLSSSSSFLPKPSSVRKTSRLNAAESLFASPGWAAIKKELDFVPTFCVANREGQPIEYEMNGVPLAVFYCDVEAAKAELAEAMAGLKDTDGLDLIPFPMGTAFQLATEGKAKLVPSAKAMAAAGAPPGADPVGQEVPLFACMEIMREGDDGTPRLPLFLDVDEATAAMQAALEDDEPGAEPYNIVGLSLGKAVQMLATVPETPAFQFVTPSSSVTHIQGYLADSGGIV